MPIETSFATIADLNTSYPTGNDYRKEGDNHLRGIKTAIKNTFPNINAAVTITDEDLNYLAGIAADPINGLGDGGAIPSGIICMWSGLNANIPAGWKLCNGTNSTPDLSDRFILGTAADDKAAGGSSHTATSSISGSHTHGLFGTTQYCFLTVDHLPPHGHPWMHATATQNSASAQANGGIVTTGTGAASVAPAYAGTPTNTSNQQIGSTGGGQGHVHAIDAYGDHSHTVDTRGKYYKLAFIMKI